MVKDYVDIVLKLCSLTMIIVAAGLWAGAVVDTRPKNRDDPTLTGGTIWSQLIIPMGLLLSKLVEERLDTFIHGYFLVTGMALCIVTGTVLVLNELNAMNTRRSVETQLNVNGSYDRMHLGIGVLSLLAGALVFTQFLLLIIP